VQMQLSFWQSVKKSGRRRGLRHVCVAPDVPSRPYDNSLNDGRSNLFGR
jgi:hypothetical protein